jgi:hypothetical protein
VDGLEGREQAISRFVRVADYTLAYTFTIWYAVDHTRGSAMTPGLCV